MVLKFHNIISSNCNTIALQKSYLEKGLLITDRFLFQDGNTPLHIAAKLGNIETLKALLSAGANPTIINDVSRSICMQYCMHGCHKIFPYAPNALILDHQ